MPIWMPQSRPRSGPSSGTREKSALQVRGCWWNGRFTTRSSRSWPEWRRRLCWAIRSIRKPRSVRLPRGRNSTRCSDTSKPARHRRPAWSPEGVHAGSTAKACSSNPRFFPPLPMIWKSAAKRFSVPSCRSFHSMATMRPCASQMTRLMDSHPACKPAIWAGRCVWRSASTPAPYGSTRGTSTTRTDHLAVTKCPATGASKAPRRSRATRSTSPSGQTLHETYPIEGDSIVKIGIIGAGNVGTGLTKHLVPNGHSVMLSFSLDMETLRATAAALGASVGTVAETVQFADVVVLATPWTAAPDALAQVGKAPSKRILWDCTNALKPDMSGLLVGTHTSGAEEIAKLAPWATVVKAIPPLAELMHSPSMLIGGNRVGVFVCGDDSDARAVVAKLVIDLQAEPVDAGPLTLSR